MYFLISLARVRCDRERGGDAAGGFCDSEGRASCTCQSDGAGAARCEWEGSRAASPLRPRVVSVSVE